MHKISEKISAKAKGVIIIHVNDRGSKEANDCMYKCDSTHEFMYLTPSQHALHWLTKKLL